MAIDFNGKNGSPFINTIEAAAILKLSPRTLEKMRQRGQGPEYFKIGNKVYYTHQTLWAWSSTRLRRSTCDPPGLGRGVKTGPKNRVA